MIENNRKSLDKIISIFTGFSKQDPEIYDGPAQSTVNDALYYLTQYRNLLEWIKQI